MDASAMTQSYLQIISKIIIKDMILSFFSPITGDKGAWGLRQGGNMPFKFPLLKSVNIEV